MNLFDCVIGLGIASIMLFLLGEKDYATINPENWLKEQIGICKITARSMRMERKYYIDNLRWLAILLLIPFHAAQIWSGGEYSGFYIWSHINVPIGVAGQFLLIVLISFVATFLIFEIIKKVPVLRFFHYAEIPLIADMFSL